MDCSAVQRKQLPLIPFDSTPSGILKNTVLGLPKASIDVAKGAVEKVASTVKKTQDKVVARAKEVVTNPKVLVQEAKDHVPNFDIAFNFSKQYTPEQQKNEQQKLTNAIAGTTGGEDLVARKLRGSITETAIKYFKDEVNPERIKGALHSLGAPVESIDNLTESLSKAKTTDEVKQAIIEESQKYNIRTTKPQVSDEGIQIAPNLRQRYLMEGRLNPGEPMRMLRDPEGRPIQTQRLETKLSPTVDQTLPDTATSISQYLPDTEGGTLESKLEQLRQTQLKGNGESLSNIIDKEAPDVNKKVGWHDYLKTPEYVLKRLGSKMRPNFCVPSTRNISPNSLRI
jgi:hypothetical protein